MTKALSSDLLARTAAILGTILVISVLLYGTLILLMVRETAYRAAAESSIRSLTAELGTLERQFLAAEESITLAKAEELGFHEARQVTRVTRYVSAPTALSLGNAAR